MASGVKGMFQSTCCWVFCKVLAKASTAPPKPRAPPPPLSFRHLPTYGECFEPALVASPQWNYGGDVVSAAVLLERWQPQTNNQPLTGEVKVGGGRGAAG